jgi:hypothetical protein
VISVDRNVGLAVLLQAARVSIATHAATAQ